MNTPEDPRDPDLDWIGCEAMLSVPAFGLQPVEPTEAACSDAGAASRWAADQSPPPSAIVPGPSFC